MVIDFRVCCYINGRLFWPRSVTYITQQGDLHTFTVDMPAVSEWEILPVRSHCAVFFTDPVTKTWRFLCEGEYDRSAKSKGSHGERVRTLMFRALHHYWRSATYTSMFSLCLTAKKDQVLTSLPNATINGNVLTFPGKPPGGQIQDIMSLITASTASGGSMANQPSNFIPAFINLATQQTPVEAYYNINRKLMSKMHTLQDTAISQVITNTFAKDLFTNINLLGLGVNMSLSDIVFKYEDVTLYQHVSIPAPYRFPGNPTDKIMETLFMPHLYFVIPPACNVIFQDQIQTQTVNRDFMQENTRVIMTIQQIVCGLPVPEFYMANTMGSMVRNTHTALNPNEASTHDFLSEEECIKGVVAAAASIGFEKLSQKPGGDDKNPNALKQWETYKQEATKHHLGMNRGRARTATLHCTFLPYLVPGFPCLVEDTTGPFFGIISSIQHTMPCTGTPSTSVSIAFMQETYQIQGQVLTPPLPVWLNRKFAPIYITPTYKELLGLDNSGGFGKQRGLGVSAMVPDKDISDNTSASTPDSIPQADLDALAALVVTTPMYSPGFTSLISKSSNTAADKIRELPEQMRELAFLDFQYRTGLGFAEYWNFHGLQAATNPEPPDCVSASSGVLTVGDPLFSHPKSLSLLTKDAYTASQKQPSPGVFGYYTANGNPFMPLRQNAAYTIQQAINKQISLV